MASQASPNGAIDLAIDENDRLYVLTAIGVQCVRSYGLIDAILDLPDKSHPLMISFGDRDGDMLYVRTEIGVYKRKMCNRGASKEATEPKHVGYYD